MYEDMSMKAIFIGAGILVAIATISAVMSYYSIAKQTATGIVGTSKEIETVYRSDIETSLLKSYLSGTEVKNIIMYFQNVPNVIVNVANMKVSNTQTASYNNLNNDTTNYLKVIDNIRTEFMFSLSKTESATGVITITVTGQD